MKSSWDSLTLQLIILLNAQQFKSIISYIINFIISYIKQISFEVESNMN